jgi:NADPH:quinone reductase-like Zn-dependent oxidoreductase
MAKAPDGLAVVEVPKPDPGPGEVLIRVEATSINASDTKVLAGAFVGRFVHARSVPLVVGYDFSGVVEEVGAGVEDVKLGASVWGHLAYSGKTQQGAFAEYVVLGRENVALRPEPVPRHVAAAAATAGLTSIQALRDRGHLGHGGRALIVGAGGGVGSLAVGVAKRLGAEVVAVCSAKDVDRVGALGADTVLDRGDADPFAQPDRYDVVFDTPGAHSFHATKRSLVRGGVHVSTIPGPAFLSSMLLSLFSSKSYGVFNVASKREDLELLGSWIADGLQAPIDSRHPIRNLASALARFHEKGRVGKIVIEVADGW